MNHLAGQTLRQQIIAEDMAAINAACHAELASLADGTLLLTGATGFIGSYLLQSLATWNLTQPAHSIRVILPTRSVSKALAKHPAVATAEWLRWVTWDELATVPDQITHALHGASPADPQLYMQQPWQTLHDIVGKTEAVLSCLRRHPVQALLYLSSGAVYGRQPETMAVIPETYMGAPDVTDPRSCYAEAKRYCEMLCYTSGVPTVSGRLFAFLGPNQDLSSSFAVPDFIRQAKETGKIIIKSDGTALRSYCYASDLTIMLWKLLCAGGTERVYNVGGEAVVSLKELAEQIAALVGGVAVEVHGKPTAVPPARYIPDIARLKTIFAPQVALSQALQRVLQSHQNERKPA